MRAEEAEQSSGSEVDGLSRSETLCQAPRIQYGHPFISLESLTQRIVFEFRVAAALCGPYSSSAVVSFQPIRASRDTASPMTA